MHRRARSRRLRRKYPQIRQRRRGVGEDLRVQHRTGLSRVSAPRGSRARSASSPAAPPAARSPQPPATAESPAAPHPSSHRPEVCTQRRIAHVCHCNYSNASAAPGRVTAAHASGAPMLCLILYSPAMTSQPRPMRVLVIDDDPMSRDLLRVLLQAEGYEVECADSGEDAITWIHHTATAPGLVLADVQMPGLAGSRLAGELRSFCPPETLLLLMSGSRPPAQILARFDGFLLKPFSMKDVADMLAERNPSPSAKKPLVRREQWTVVRGPASRSPSSSRLVSIAASSEPQTASKKDARSQRQEGPVRRDCPRRQIQRRAGVERDNLSPACSFHAHAAAPPDVRDVCQRCTRAHRLDAPVGGLARWGTIRSPGPRHQGRMRNAGRNRAAPDGRGAGGARPGGCRSGRLTLLMSCPPRATGLSVFLGHASEQDSQSSCARYRK